MQFRSSTPEQTAAAARDLAAAIREVGRGLTLGLIGPLGAGKTHFVQGIAAGLGIDPTGVSSPTFVIANQYPFVADGVERFLAHVDLYRVGSVEELDQTGFLDLLAPGAVVAVEWADRLPEALPADRLELRIGRELSDPDSRTFAASATGKDSREVLEAWRVRITARV